MSDSAKTWYEDAAEKFRLCAEHIEAIGAERDQLKAELATLRESEDAAQHAAKRTGDELANLQAEREPRYNGDGTETRLLPVTYPKGLPVECVRVPRLGDAYLPDCGEVMSTNKNYTPKHPRLILRPAPKPTEPVTWEAPLCDGLWDVGYGRVFAAGCCQGLDASRMNAPKDGRYQFANGVGALIEAAQ